MFCNSNNEHQNLKLMEECSEGVITPSLSTCLMKGTEMGREMGVNSVPFNPVCYLQDSHEGSLKMLSSPKCRWGNRHLERTCPGYTASRWQSYRLSHSLSAARLALSIIPKGKIILSKFSEFHKWEVPAALFAIPSTSFRFQRARISLEAGV